MMDTLFTTLAKWKLIRIAFNKLIANLNSGRGRAIELYVIVRRKLLISFDLNHCLVAEETAAPQLNSLSISTERAK